MVIRTEIKEQLHEEIKAYAKRNGLTLSACYSQAAEFFLTKKLHNATRKQQERVKNEN